MTGTIQAASDCVGDGVRVLGAQLLPTVEAIPVRTWKTSNGFSTVPAVTMAVSGRYGNICCHSQPVTRTCLFPSLGSSNFFLDGTDAGC